MQQSTICPSCKQQLKNKWQWNNDKHDDGWSSPPTSPKLSIVDFYTSSPNLICFCSLWVQKTTLVHLMKWWLDCWGNIWCGPKVSSIRDLMQERHILMGRVQFCFPGKFIWRKILLVGMSKSLLGGAVHICFHCLFSHQSVCSRKVSYFSGSSCVGHVLSRHITDPCPPLIMRGQEGWIQSRGIWIPTEPGLHHWWRGWLWQQ